MATTRPATGRRPSSHVQSAKLDATRDLLDQMDTTTRLLASSMLSQTVRSRLLSTADHLARQLPAPDAGVDLAADSLEASGPAWVTRFPGSNEPQDCVTPFRERLEAFLGALTDAQAHVDIAATLRPPERAYLMHWSWLIATNVSEPDEAQAMAGVNIDWVHRDSSGTPDIPKSRSAAKQMVSGFGIVATPALQSRHTQGRAVDMSISWSSTLKVKDAEGTIRTIASTPRNGMNADLIACGATYGVIKAAFANDPPHWSDDGH